MAPPDVGLKNETLQASLREAIAGNPARLEDLLCRHGAVLTPQPNVKLAAAFGVEIGTHPSPAIPRLLARLGQDDAAPDTSRAFLPIAAAHGWAARVRAGRDVEMAWAALAVLAADERAPVRLGAIDALLTLAVREGGAEILLARAVTWIELDDREVVYGAAAMVVDLLAKAQVLSALHDHGAMLDYLTAVLGLVAEAPRSAARSDALRRLTLALPATLAAVVALPGGGLAWLQQHCRDAFVPELRQVLSEGVVRVGRGGRGQSASVVAALRQSLQGSAKPLRDPSRLRPGTGRGKSTRQIR